MPEGPECAATAKSLDKFMRGKRLYEDAHAVACKKC